jgi:signal transduction histidine kinase
MRRWLGGKRGGLIAFLLIAGLVLGSLGWVTVTALRLEREQLAGRAQWERERAEAEWAQKLRVALYRLDIRVNDYIAQEANRPYQQYLAQPLTRILKDQVQGNWTITICDLTPQAEPPPWNATNYFVAPETEWPSPQALRDALVKHLNVSSSKLPAEKPAAVEAMNELPAPETFNRLWTQIRNQQQELRNTVQAETPQAEAQLAQAVQQRAPGNFGLYGNDLNKAGQGDTQKNIDRDTTRRLMTADRGAGRGGPSQLVEPNDGPPRKDPQPPVLVGPPFPLWLTDAPRDQLVMARFIQIGNKLIGQVALLDWPELQHQLADEVGDLFPEARFRPVRDREASAPERTMTALPVELDPGPPPMLPPEPAGTSLRLGLSLAWAAALVALLAVGLGGWSLLDLSERRIRFVSAVTHELRTPLTTLRLYLDMLTGGLVKSEKQQAEYLHTLNTETDRLNRLISNVLDFSRLENNRPRLNRSAVRLADLLGQVEATWQGRCGDNDKELVLENALPADTLLETDGELVQQVLANLIDNSCKYSREAKDRRLWLRARQGGADRLVLEVEDRGPGVPAGQRRSIFRPFHRGPTADVTAGGVGLGLALARRWACLLGGQLTCCPGRDDVGACFRLELPLSSCS